MANRFIIGRGDLLTYPIDAPRKKPSHKKRPYTVDEAKQAILPQMNATAAAFDALPSEACPSDVAVARITLHPAYLSKSYFPGNLLRSTGLVSVGSRTRRIKPRKNVRAKAPAQSDTTELFVAGTRKAFRELANYAQNLTEEMPEGEQLSEIEAFAPMQPTDRLKVTDPKAQRVFEVGLHLIPGSESTAVLKWFANYAHKLGFQVRDELQFQAGRLLFFPIEGNATAERLEKLAAFSLVRIIRAMPKLRAARPLQRSTGPAVKFSLPNAAPLSNEPRVAILDGGLPEQHSLTPFVRYYFLADPDANDVEDYVNHGLGVTSAFLFGPLEAGAEAVRPYSYVDHHRVLDSVSDKEDPYELYRTLQHVETVLTSRSYDFINLSLGPALPVEDHEVHAWTAKLDELLSDGNTLLTVAVGNNGEMDSALGHDRIQVPSDSVNALSVGATDHSGASWKRAKYSAKGPGRVPGRRKPDIVAFGGCPKEYFHQAAAGMVPQCVANMGTSFSSPLALRSAVGIRAVLGTEIHPLTAKALLIHCADAAGHAPEEVGWGRIPDNLNEIITCGDGVARIIYQGVLLPGKFLRAPVPLPPYGLEGKVSLSATFCYACPVDPQDVSAYTKAGLVITFRPNKDKKKEEAKHATATSFFPSAEFRNEQELRDDLGKWEPVLHATHTYYGSTLNEATFDIHYNARDGGANSTGAERIRYALILTVTAKKHPTIYEDILKAHTLLKALEPQISIPLTT